MGFFHELYLKLEYITGLHYKGAGLPSKELLGS